MSYRLVVSEKPSVAMAYAKVLGATNRKDGYMEGNGYLVSWCVGHLVELGVYYSGARTKNGDCYVAYNMHCLEQVFALPALPKGYGWYVRATTDRGILDYPELLKDQRKAELKERSIVVFTADRIVEVETKKNESITTLTDDQSS